MLISILHWAKYSPNPMLKGKQTNRIQHASVCLVGEAFNKFFTSKVFWHDSTVCVKKEKKRKSPLMVDIQFMTLLETFTMLPMTVHTANDCRPQ